MTKKVQIIHVDLNLDLDAEIKAKVANISPDIKVYTDGLIERAGLKQQKISKKQQEQQIWDTKMGNALKLLVTAQSSEDPWVDGETLLKAAEMDNQSQFTARMKNFLRKNDEWILIKSTKKNKAVYSLQRFGKAD